MKVTDIGTPSKKLNDFWTARAEARRSRESWTQEHAPRVREQLYAIAKAVNDNAKLDHEGQRLEVVMSGERNPVVLVRVGGGPTGMRTEANAAVSETGAELRYEVTTSGTVVVEAWASSLSRDDERTITRLANMPPQDLNHDVVQDHLKDFLAFAQQHDWAGNAHRIPEQIEAE
ncbi:MAG: hypothetical protein ACODAG_11780 [Myxococcota bacterium]